MTRLNVITQNENVAVWVADERGIVELSACNGKWFSLLLKAYFLLKWRTYGKR